MSGGEKRKPVFAPYYKGGRRLHIGMAELAEDFGGSVSKAALGSVSVMKMAAGYLGKAVVASKVEKKTDQAGRPLNPNAGAAADDEEGVQTADGPWNGCHACFMLASSSYCCASLLLPASTCTCSTAAL